MPNPILVPELLELIDSGDRAQLLEVVEELHPAEIAEFAAALHDADIWRLLASVPQTVAAEIFSNFELDRQVDLASGANRQAMARMLEELPHDDRADLVQRMDRQVAEQILPLVARAEREDIRKLASYEEGTAGALMSSDYATLRPDITVAQALDLVRAQAPTKETIYYIYVVDDAHRLIGLVSLKDLILARPSQLVRDIMHEEVIFCNVNEDQETVARKIEKYDLLAIPVTNGENKLIGIITHDDTMDVIRQEQQEDVEKLMAIGGRHQIGQYMNMPVVSHFRNRAPWLVVLAILGLVSGLIVMSFESLLARFSILIAFIPMLADTGGNTGSQSATLVIRALALGEISTTDALRVLFKEFRVSIMLAVVLACVAFGRVLAGVAIFGGEGVPAGYSLVWVGMAISVALGLQVISATLLGAILPLVAAKFNRDPALIASPALTTVVDMSGVLLFFGTVRLLLNI